jgi:RimJ/RimL family protein N-acetyltransferase
MPRVELLTPRLSLREFRDGDHAAVHAFASDPEVTRYTDWGPNDPDDTSVFLAKAAQNTSAQPRTRYPLAVVERAGDVLIGSVDIHVVSREHRRGEMGYVLNRSRWGHGYATEAAAAVLRFGFDRLGLHRISATCDPDNTASARVLERIGMRAEGHLREYLCIGGEWRDRLLYAALDR